MTAAVATRQKIAARAAYPVFVALAALGLASLRGYFHDDAFIFFRYARNLADGSGWTFNAGRPTANAATSPLWVLLLAIARVAHIGIPFAASIVSVIALAGAGALVFETFALRGEPRAGFLAGAMVTGSQLLAVNRGMELPLGLLFIAAAVYAAERGLPVITGLALAALGLCRGDGVLLAGPLLAALWLRHRRPPWRTVAAAVVGLAPWLVYAQIRFGRVLPDTLGARVDQGRSGFWGPQPLYLKGLLHVPSGYDHHVWFMGAAVLGL